MKTYSAKTSHIKKEWWIIDAKNLILGRLASQVAILVRGKHKTIFTPHIDCGDNVIVINARYVKLTGNKGDPQNGKVYYRHTGFPGGIKRITAGKILLGPHPERVIKAAVRRMISRNILGAKQFSNLYVYANDTHPHIIQQPKIIHLKNKNPKNNGNKQ